MAYTLTGLTSMGKVIKEAIIKDAQLFQMPMPGSDASSAILADLFGAQLIITITGIFTSADGTITTFIDELEALIDGTQTSVTFHSDKSGNDYVGLIQNARWDDEPGAVGKLNYEISMIVGTAL